MAVTVTAIGVGTMLALSVGIFCLGTPRVNERVKNRFMALMLVVVISCTVID